MLRQNLDLGSVQLLVRAESGKRSGRRSSANALMHEERHDGIVQRRHVVLRVFVNENRDFFCGAFRQHSASILVTGGH
jgi:hypothetical protein